jgi:hypothetical protein
MLSLGIDRELDSADGGEETPDPGDLSHLLSDARSGKVLFVAEP